MARAMTPDGDAARIYAMRSWAPIPIPAREKRPKLKKWQKLRIGPADVPRYFNGRPGNVGIILGDASRGLVDLDLDCREASELAGLILPRTGSIFGRPGKPASHRLYHVTDGAPNTIQFEDPVTGEMLVEMRGNGGSQTVFPPSVHPSGETVEWEIDEEPGPVIASEIVAASKRLAAACLMKRYGIPNWTPNSDPASWPDFLEQNYDERVGRKLRTWLGLQQEDPQRDSNRRDSGGRHSAYAHAALDREVAAVARAGKGSRNTALNRAAFNLGQLVGARHLERTTVEAELYRAATACGLIADEGEKQARATIESGLEKGILNPREIPEQSPPNGRSSGKAPPALSLSLAEWLVRDISPADFLVGEWLSTTTRALFVAPSGLGKTNVCLALAISLAGGRDFLHWRVQRQARVLYIDGEMSRRLMKQRLEDAVRRCGDAPANLFVFCRDDLPEMAPLNTSEGQAFIDRLVKMIGGVDFIVFDNIQALIIGDMKEEDSWRDTLPWIKSLTQRRIGQLWVHHTGHDETKSYGTKTREWQLDAVTMLERIERPDADIAFSIKFTKARERAPHNRSDFEPVIVTLVDDQWKIEGAQRRTGRPPSPKARIFHKGLLDALSKNGTVRPDSSAGRPSVTMDEWRGECRRLGLVESGNDRAACNRAAALFSKYRTELVAAGWAVCNGDVVWNGSVPY